MKKLAFIIFIGFSQLLSSQQSELQQDADCYIENVLQDFNEQANLHFSKGEYARSLDNYQKVICYLKSSGFSDPSNLLQALCGSMFCYDILNHHQFAKAAFDELVLEVALLNEKIEEIDWFRQSLIYPKFIENPNRYDTKIEKIGLQEKTPEENCQFQCNGYAVAAAFACGKVPNLAVQFVCYGCIFGLEQLCLRCCKGNGFWENCVKGLRRLFHDPQNPENPAPHPYE